MTGPRIGPPDDPTEALRASLFVATQRPDPAQWARILKAAAAAKLPPTVAQHALPQLEQAQAQQAPDPARLQQDAPGLADWLADPDNATLAHRETAPLTTVDQQARALTPPPTRPPRTSWLQALFGGWYAPTAPSAKPLEAAGASLAGEAGVLRYAFGLAGDDAIDGIAAHLKSAEATRASYPAFAKAYTDARAQHDDPTHADRRAFLNAVSASGTGGTVLDWLDRAWTAAQHLRGFAYTSGESLAKSAPMLGGTMAGGAAGSAIAGPAGGVAGGIWGTFAGAAPMNVAGTLVEQLQQRGVDVTDPVALRAAFHNPALMAQVREYALRKGLTAAVVQSATMPFANLFAGKAAAAGAGRLATAGAVAADAAGQAAAQTGADVAGTTVAGGRIEPGQVAQGFVDNLFLGLAIEGVGHAREALSGHTEARAALPADPVEAARALPQQIGDALDAVQRAHALQTLTAAVAEAKTTADVPEALRALVETATGHGEGDEAATVYFQTSDWDAAMQAAGEAPADAAARLLGDGGAAYDQARATGTPLAIPLGQYVAGFAKTPERFDALLPVARTRPDGPSLAEAKATLEATPALVQQIAADAQAAAQAAAQQDAATPSTDPAAPIAERVQAALEAAGRSKVEAQAGARLWAAFFRTVGEREGIAPQTLYDRYAPAIRGGAEAPATAAPPDLALAAQDALQQGAYHGSPHIFEKFALQRIGSGEGNQSFGWGLYFAQKKDVAKAYREALSPEFILRDGQRIPDAEWNTMSWAEANALKAVSAQGVDASLRAADRMADEGADPAYLAEYRAAVEALRGRNVTRERGGRLYAVNIPGDETMLDWDKPLRDQPEQVRAAIVRLETDLWRERYQHYSAEDRVWFTPDDLEARIAELPDDIARSRQTGQSYYRELSTLDGSEPTISYIGLGQNVVARGAEAASRRLARYGINGLRYLDQGSRTAGEGTYNYVIFDDKLVQITGYEQRRPSESGPRGQIRFGRDGTIGIDLFQSADRSTFAHESAHFFYHVLEDLASLDTASAGLKADAATLRDWVQATPGEALTRAQQEQIARGFEAYLMEGKAPSVELRSTFRRFRDWLTRLYQRATALGVEVSDPVRQVFDRLLASEAAIRGAEAETAARPLFPDPQALGLTEAQAARYQRAIDAARATAEDRLTAVVMRDLRREETAEFKRLRKAMEPDIVAEVDADPLYRALDALTGARPLDGLDGVKLDRAAAKALLPDGAKLPPKVAVDEGGLPPDAVAELLGFESGQQLVEALALAPKKKARVKTLLDARMRDQHGEPLADGELETRARAAVLSTQQDAVLREELAILATQRPKVAEGLADVVARPVVPAQTLADAAEKVIGAIAVNQLRPAMYEAAASRHGREAFRAVARGDFAAAFAAKERQRVAAATYRAALEAKTRVSDGVETFKWFRRADTKLTGKYDIDLVNAGRAILAEYGIGAKGDSADKFLRQMQEYDPDRYATIAPRVDAAVQRAADVGGTWKALPLADFDALVEVVNGIKQQARVEQQHLIDGREVDRDLLVGEFQQRFEALPAKHVVGEDRAPTDAERRTRSVLQFSSWLRRVESWVDLMDGGAPNGIFRRAIWTPISEAATRFRGAKAEALARYQALVEQHRAIFEAATYTAKIDATKELQYTFRDKGELLGALLHTGNGSNLEKLLLGGRGKNRPWGALREDGTLDTGRWQAFLDRMHRDGVLTKADWDFVQGVWNLYDSLKRDAQQAHHRMFGFYFNEVTAEPVQTPFGQYKGGYAPAKADPFLVEDQQIKAERERVLNGDQSFMFPTTGRGFTRSRVAYNRPLILDLGMVTSHLDAVLRFTHLEPRVKEVGRLITDPRFREPLATYDPTAGKDMLVPWLQRAAQQQVSLRGQSPAMDKFWTAVRHRTGMQSIAFNVINGFQQLTGITVAAVKVPPADLSRALWRYIREPRVMAAEVAERSPYMATRLDNAIGEATQAINDLLAHPTKYDDLQAAALKHGHFLNAGLQSIVDSVTWTGAYDHAVRGGASPEEAVRIADSAVRLTQGGASPEDLARFEAQTPFVRTFTMFSGYFNMQANLLATEFTKTMRDVGLRKGAGRLAYVYVLGFMLPAVLSETMTKLGRGKGFDEDDDGPADDALGLFFGSQSSGLARMIPVVGPIAEGTVRALTGKPDARVSTSSAVTTIERATGGTAKDAYDAIHGKTVGSKGIRDVFTLLGLLSGLPLAPVGRAIGYERDRELGRAQPTGPFDYTRGVITGSTGAR